MLAGLTMINPGARPNIDIDLSLAVLEVVRPKCRPLEQKEISDIVGCSRPYISYLERCGKEKIRKRHPELSEYLE